MKILSFIKTLFCRHRYKFYKRFETKSNIVEKLKCPKCGGNMYIKYDKKEFEENTLFPKHLNH